MIVKSFFCTLKVNPQNKLFLTTLPYYGPCKMANFATFLMIERVVSVCFWYFESQSSYRSFVTILFCYGFCKMAIVATFSVKIVPFLKCEVFFSRPFSGIVRF